MHCILPMFSTFMLKSEHMMYVFYGSLAVLIWKCGTQLLKEVKYHSASDEDDKMKKAKLTKGTKYSKVFY